MLYMRIAAYDDTIVIWSQPPPLKSLSKSKSIFSGRICTGISNAKTRRKTKQAP
jgi:hypothetical protein